MSEKIKIESIRLIFDDNGERLDEESIKAGYTLIVNGPRYSNQGLSNYIHITPDEISNNMKAILEVGKSNG